MSILSEHPKAHPKLAPVIKSGVVKSRENGSKFIAWTQQNYVVKNQDEQNILAPVKQEYVVKTPYAPVWADVMKANREKGWLYTPEMFPYIIINFERAVSPNSVPGYFYFFAHIIYVKAQPFIVNDIPYQPETEMTLGDMYMQLSLGTYWSAIPWYTIPNIDGRTIQSWSIRWSCYFLCRPDGNWNTLAQVWDTTYDLDWDRRDFPLLQGEVRDYNILTYNSPNFAIPCYPSDVEARDIFYAYFNDRLGFRRPPGN